MAKITIAGNAVVITSAVRLEDIELIRRYRPDALELMGGEDGKEPIFAIYIAQTGEMGSLGRYGAVFDKETYNNGGFATITESIHTCGETDVKTAVADKFGVALTRLNALEQNLPGVVESIRAEKEAVMANITVAQ